LAGGIVTLYRLRYSEAAVTVGRPRSIRYPNRRGVDLETAEKMRAAMPDPELFEIVSEDELALKIRDSSPSAWENVASPQGALTPAGSDHLPLSTNERG
jgi:hypothetical protein